MSAATASAAPLSRPLLPAVSTKHYQYDDPIARLILPEFQERVDPKLLTLFLPHDLLTDSDEDRVLTRQNSEGRTEAAKLLLALIAQRNDWVPKLQEGLRHREIRLGDFADRIDDLHQEVPMEVDLADDLANLQVMDVDADPLFPLQDDLSPILQTLLAGRHPRDLGAEDLARYKQLVVLQIAEEFFTTNIARTIQDVRQLTECYERIAAAVTTSYAIGCLELRLRIASSRDLRKLRRLVEGDMLRVTIERAVLTKERRDWLEKTAASFGLEWRELKVKVKVKEADLDRCESFLRSMEEGQYPKTPAEAALYKMAASEKHLDNPDVLLFINRLPKLLLSFLDWLMQDHPVLAEEVATVFLAHVNNVKIVLLESMAVCRRNFGLVSDLEADFYNVVKAMLEDMLDRTVRATAAADTEEAESAAVKSEPAESTAVKTEAEESAAIKSESTAVKTETAESTAEASEPAKAQMKAKLVLRGTPQPNVKAAAERLVKLKLMHACHEEGEEGQSFCFSSPFVQDFALTCPMIKAAFKKLVPLTPFTILHVVDKIFCTTSTERNAFASGLRSKAEYRRSGAEGGSDLLLTFAEKVFSAELVSHDAMELILACECPIKPYPSGAFPITSFGPHWKRHFVRSKLSGNFDFDIRDEVETFVCTLTVEEMQAVADLANEVLSCKHSINLSGKLTNLSEGQLKVVFACCQLTSLAKFSLKISGGYAVLTWARTTGKQEDSSENFQHLTLNLSENVLTDVHVQCLLGAVAGLESVSRMNLSGCQVSRGHLQNLLDSFCPRSLRRLNLGRIQFTDSSSQTVPGFSHLPRLQSVDLGSLGLQDSHMPELCRQLRALPDLRELTLDNNPITTAGLSLLSPALAACSSLRALRVSHYQLDAGAAFVLGSLLTSARNLHVLNLSRCRLQDSGLQHLSLVLQDHCLLSQVSLREGGYTVCGLGCFLATLAKCGRMQRLDLGNCPLEEDEMQVTDELLKALAGSCLWDFLGLWQCRLGRTSFLQRLPGALPTQLRGLSELVLQDNDLNDDHVDHFTVAVKAGVFRSLRRLNLSYNPISKAGAQSLSQVVPLLPRLSQLQLRHTAIPRDDALAMCRALLPLPDMTLLDLSDAYNMSVHDVNDIGSELERMVRESNIAVGGAEAVSLAERDKQLEQVFAEGRLKSLGFEQIPKTSRAWSEHTEKMEDAAPPLPPPRRVASGSATTTKTPTPLSPSLPRLSPFLPEETYEDPDHSSAYVQSSPPYPSLPAATYKATFNIQTSEPEDVYDEGGEIFEAISAPGDAYEGGEGHDDDYSEPMEIYEDLGDLDYVVIPMSPKSEPGTPQVRYRSLVVRQGNDVIVDDTFRIKLGHNET